jgi:ferritin
MDIRQQILKPYTLSGEVIALLTERLEDEYTAHYFYRNASNWCEEKAYLKAAAFFAKEAANELEHAQKLQKYLVDWNVLPTIPGVNMQPTFTSLIDIVNKAYQLEYNLFLEYNANSAEIFPGDMATFDFLQELRMGQNESVAEYATLLNGAELVDIDNKLDVLYYENQYFG